MFKERILASRDKEDISAEVIEKEPKPEYESIIRDLYILELEHNGKHYEKDLETALINHLQKFLLELGCGFCFEARQKHFRVEDEHFYIDLALIDISIESMLETAEGVE